MLSKMKSMKYIISEIISYDSFYGALISYKNEQLVVHITRYGALYIFKPGIEVLIKRAKYISTSSVDEFVKDSRLKLSDCSSDCLFSETNKFTRILYHKINKQYVKQNQKKAQV